MQLGFIRSQSDRHADRRADRQIGRVCVGASGRGTADRQMEFWGQTVAAQIGAHSQPVFLLLFIALLQVYPGNSKARPLLKPTTVKVTGNCGTALVKRPVCLQLNSALLVLDAKLGEAGRGSS